MFKKSNYLFTDLHIVEMKQKGKHKIYIEMLLGLQHNPLTLECDRSQMFSPT